MSSLALDAPTQTHERFAKRQDRVIDNFGASGTAGGKALGEKYLPRLSAAFTEALAEELSVRRRAERDIRRLLGSLSPVTVALCTLQAAIDAAAQEQSVSAFCELLGRDLWWESWAHELLSEDRKGVTKLVKQVKSKASSLKVRRTAFRALARKQGYSIRSKPWDVRTRVIVGAWALQVLLQALPEAFETVESRRAGSPEYVNTITVTPEALNDVYKAYDAAMLQHPVFMVSTEPPRSWVSSTDGGPADERMQRYATLIRTHRASLLKRVDASIRSGAMQPALDALNTIQNTAWCINARVLAVIEELRVRQIDVPGLPRVKDFVIPPHPGDEADKFAKDLWRYKARKTREANRTLTSDRLSFHRDLNVARAFCDEPRFYAHCNMDFRGREYAGPFFNFQRSDPVRALHLFADGEPIGAEGLYWLKVHTANCGAFDKIDKQSFEERVQWVDSNLSKIKSVVDSPLDSLPWWSQADQPFLFLAACLELSAAVATGPEYVTRLPVSWDGSCSGLQHLCAMTRASEGELVNLTAQERPADVYQTVADAVAISVMEDAAEYGPDVASAKDWMEQGVTRSTVKRNVMTYAYSSKKFGMAEQQREDLMKPLELKVLEGALEEHPFGPDNGMSASVYIAEKVHRSIEQVVQGPAEAMGFLQELAKVMAAENKPLRWTTPAGLPWENRYNNPVVKRLDLFLRDTRVCLNVATGNSPKLNRSKAANAVAPNFVHACDAAHLLLTVNAAVAEGINSFALVHDSFGCLANRSGQMHRIIRETFVRMYEEHDVLQEVLECAQADLTNKAVTLPTPPAQGGLNIKEVLNARYAFA